MSQQRPKEWHEFVPGEEDLNYNRYCVICGGGRYSSDHLRCCECGDYDIHMVCGAGCNKGTCKTHAKSHWCKASEDHYRDDRRSGGR